MFYYAKISCLLLWLSLYAASVTAKDFKEFRVRHFDDYELPQNSIGDIYSDGSGYLWISTQMGLVRYDGHEFQTFTPQNNAVIKNIRSQFFMLDKDQNLYMNDGSGVYKIEHGSLQLISTEWTQNAAYKYIYRLGKTNPLPASILDAPQGTFFMSEHYVKDGKVFTYVLGRDTITYTTNVFRPSFFLESSLITFSNSFAPVTLHPGRAGNHPVPLTIAGPLAKKLKPDSLHQLAGFYKFNKLYLLFNSTIYKTALRNDTLFTDELISHIEISGITSFHADERNGFYAIGTVSHGLYLLYPKSFFVRLLDGGDWANIFYSVQPVRDHLFMNSKGYVFDIYKNYQKRFIDHMAPFALFRDGNHILATSHMAIWRYDVNTDVYQRLASGNNGWLQSGFIDKWGRRWLATPTNVGRYEHDSVAWMWKVNGAPWATNADYAETIYVKDYNTLWISTRARLFSLDLNTHKLSDIPGMNVKYVRNIVKDSNGVWLLSYGNGYYYYKDGKLTRMPLDRDGYLSTPHTMLPDRNGFFWISTNKGLFRVKRSSLYSYLAGKSASVQYEYFDKMSGFLTNEFNGGCFPSGYVASDSLFLLPSMRGLVYFNPLNIAMAPLDNEIHIDKVMIDGKPQPVLNNYDVAADFLSFRCDVSSPYFGTKENMILDYKIDGYVKGWHPLINNRYLEFNRLPYGTYKVRIRKLVDFATGATSEVVIRIRVATPWYLSMWFISFLIVTGIGLIWLFIWLRLRLLTLQKLEAQVRDRTNELKSTVEILEQSQADLHKSNQFREQLTAIVLHDIQTPLRFLKRLVKYLKQTHTDMSPAQLNKELEDLYYSTAEVAAYSEDFLVWIKSQKDAFELAHAPVVLAGLLEEIGNLYHKIAANTGTVIEISCPEDIVLYTDLALLSIIVRNLTDNAVKYTPNGRVAISGQTEGDFIIIQVKDNGEGMSEEQLAKILGAEERVTVVASGEMGYQFIKDLLRILNGNLKIASKQGEGTTVSLYFTTQRSGGYGPAD